MALPDASMFGRTAWSTPQYTLTRDAQRFLQSLQDILGGTTGVIAAGSVVFAPSGGLSSLNVQDAIDELDTEKQTKDATLTALAAVATVADRLIYATGSDVFTTTTFTGFARTLLDDADAATARTTLGLGTLATQSGTFSGTSSGTNTGDQTITLTGDVTGSGTGSFAATVGKIGGFAVTLAGALTTSGAFASTFTMTGVTTVTFPTSGTLAVVGGNLGAHTGTSLAVTGALTSSGTAGIGYATGAGGTQTQLTDKSTTVILNKISGEITMNAAALNAGTTVSFTLTNSTIAATDVLVLNHASAGTAGAYTLNAQAGGGSASINVRNVTAGNLSEAIVIRFAVVKAVTS